MKMICFSHAGGIAGYYTFFKKENIEEVSEVILFEYPGRGRNASVSCYENFDKCIEDACRKIVELGVRDEEFVLFGHSMGAFVAYETACRLKKDYKLHAFHVFLSGQKPPCRIMPEHYKLCEKSGMDFLKKLGGVPEVILENQDIFRFFLEICAVDLRVLQSYKPHAADAANRPMRGSIICGDNDAEVAVEELEDWKDYFEIPPTINVVSGTHFYIQDRKKELVGFMNEELKKTKMIRMKRNRKW